MKCSGVTLVMQSTLVGSMALSSYYRGTEYSDANYPLYQHAAGDGERERERETHSASNGLWGRIWE